MSPRDRLSRDLGLVSLFALSFGTIIGVGWITVMGEWLELAGSLGAALAFTIGAGIIGLIALCYAELASMYPVSGGEVAYAYRMYGPRIAFLCGWLLALNYIALLAFEAISIGWVLSAMAPALKGPVIYTVLGSDVTLWSLTIGLGVMAVLALFQFLSVKSVGRLQEALTVCLLTASLVFITAGVGFGDLSNLSPYVARSDSGAIDWRAFALLLSTTFFWFAGFDVVPQAMGEKSDDAPAGKLHIVLIGSISLALLFYVAIIIATAMAAPREEILSADLPVASAFEAAFGSVWLRNLVMSAGLMGILTTWNAAFLASTRLLFALGRAYFLPHSFARVDSRFGTPTQAILFAAMIGGLLTLLGREAIGVIVNVSAMSMALVFLLVTFGVARLRRTAADHPRPFKTPFGLMTPYAAGIGSALVLVVAAWSLSDFSEGAPTEWIIFGAWLLLGLGFWRVSASERHSVSESERAFLVLDE